MNFWSIPRSSADRWRALILICELCICLLWLAAIMMPVLTPLDSSSFDHRVEKKYLADRARAMEPAIYVTLAISILLGGAATYRRRLADGKELFWPAMLFTVLGLIWTLGVSPHVPLCK